MGYGIIAILKKIPLGLAVNLNGGGKYQKG